ncbi:hypothetical protein CGLO_14451 [Colletotrichum gloeosporioides Cg-14]|uniref:Uncharacterized protein n=1 Tax=Colletotrichum gloeosporioides (strain Cg-14) TaxID=1237896 RepID=T0JU96_COLGC|nr:hypothetical protein CGLO_14451 [Colletotrichum gloeosporioides Cg-14]
MNSWLKIRNSGWN